MQTETLFMFLFIIILLGALILCKLKENCKPNKSTKVVSATVTSEPITIQPTTQPTVEPTTQPTVEPTTQPTVEPTTQPTVEPTTQPTIEPTTQPTIEPTTQPTVEPTQPTIEVITETSPTLLQTIPAVLVEEKNDEQIVPDIKTDIIVEPKVQKFPNYIVSSTSPILINKLVSKNGQYMLDAIGGLKIIRLSDNKVLWEADYSKVEKFIEGPVVGKFYPNGTIVLNDSKNYIWNSRTDDDSKLCLSKKVYPYYTLMINDDGSVVILDSHNNYSWWKKYDRLYYKNAFPGTNPTFNFWKKGFYN